ncbi:MAG: protein-L-isoaspartate(D-aspartate) O-methyltransferase, partial [Pseudomonadales bacterium]|nr:protein-L-isoaspartate(D-aspartate) O-methyltransferase [Pseudomonadales bacterium]
MIAQGIGMTSQRARARMIERLKGQGISNPKVLAAMAEVPRHPFLEEGIQQRAYDETPLPIGQGQTISSPYTVALSCELITQDRPLERVLEVGGGCGYQAAVLSKLAREVLSLERIAKLIGRARLTLRELRINNVLMKNVDGTEGFPAAAPYDAIVVAAAMPYIPAALKQQLKPGGRLVAPVGAGDSQRLFLVEALPEGGY